MRSSSSQGLLRALDLASSLQRISCESLLCEPWNPRIPPFGSGICKMAFCIPDTWKRSNLGVALVASADSDCRGKLSIHRASFEQKSKDNTPFLLVFKQFGSWANPRSQISRLAHLLQTMNQIDWFGNWSIRVLMSKVWEPGSQWKLKTSLQTGSFPPSKLWYSQIPWAQGSSLWECLSDLRKTPSPASD